MLTRAVPCSFAFFVFGWPGLAPAQVPQLQLPYVAGETWECTRGYEMETHIDYGKPYHDDRYSLDFVESSCTSYGKPIVAIAAGRVSAVSDDFGYGNYVLVDLGGGYQARYCHLVDASVKRGEQVGPGQVLGWCGNSGNVEGNACPSHPGTHVHITLYRGNAAHNGVRPEPISGHSDITPLTSYTSTNTGVFDGELSSNGGTESFGSILADPGNHYAGVHWHYTWDWQYPFRSGGLPNNCYVQNWAGSEYDTCGIIYDALGGARRAYTVRNGFYHDSNNQGWNDLGGPGPTSPLGLPITNEYPLVFPELFSSDAGGARPRSFLYENAARQDFQTGYLLYLQGGTPSEVWWEAYPTVAPGWTSLGWDKTFSYLMAMAYERNGAHSYLGVGDATGPATLQSFTAGTRTGSYYVQSFTGGMIFYHPENYQTSDVRVVLNALATNEAYYLYGQFRDFWLSNGGADARGVPTRDRYWDHDPATGDGWYEVQNFMLANGEQHYMILKNGVEWGGPAIIASSILGPNNVNTNPAAALGMPDGTPVSLGAGGEITLDLGVVRPPGMPVQTLLVYEASSAVSGSTALKTSTSTSDSLPEGYAVYGSADATAWTYLGSGVGRSAFTLSAWPPDARAPGLRYVRIVDDGDGDPNTTSPGVDVDAVTLGENVVASVHSEPCYATAGVPVTISCQVTDGAITSVRVFFKLATAANFDSLNMDLAPPDNYSVVLPGQADQSHVLYYVVARDAVGNVIKSPSLAPGFTRSYRVGLQTIASLQVPTVNDSCAASSQVAKACNVVGVVTHKKYEFSDNYFYIQEGVHWLNSGIKVFTSINSSFVPDFGDSVRVSGYIDEYYCQTEVVLFADCGTILSHNRKVRARQIAKVSDINKEENESMLVTVQGPIPVAAGFDTTDLGREFKIGSGADIAYVGDDTFFPDGLGYSIVPEPGMTLDAITGIVRYRRTNTTPPRLDPTILLRLEPRRDNDVDRDWTDAGDPNQIDVVRVFNLHQNAPNPFNPVTTIEFAVPQGGLVALRIYDARGRVMRTLVDHVYPGPVHERVAWDGRDDNGKVVSSGVYFYRLVTEDHSATRKMLLLK